MERARLAGAVNCMKFEGDRAIAENFDGLGLVNDIQANLGCPMRGRRVLLLGAGGAARGALLPFLEQEPEVLVVMNRTVAKAAALGAQFPGRRNLATGGYADFAGRAGSTSSSTRRPRACAASCRRCRVRRSHSGCLAYDLVYGKGLTPFLRLARDAGAGPVADGIGMLVEQAAEAFVWWRGVRPATSALIKKLSVPLA